MAAGDLPCDSDGDNDSDTNGELSVGLRFTRCGTGSTDCHARMIDDRNWPERRRDMRRVSTRGQGVVGAVWEQLVAAGMPWSDRRGRLDGRQGKNGD